jgi:hypothetical protein
MSSNSGFRIPDFEKGNGMPVRFQTLGNTKSKISNQKSKINPSTGSGTVLKSNFAA